MRGGNRGGMIVATGTPEQVAKLPQSHTGHFLARALADAGAAPRKRGRRQAA